MVGLIWAELNFYLQTSTNCNVGNKMSRFSCAFSIMMFNKQSVCTMVGVFSSHPLVCAAKSSPSTTIADPTNHVANSKETNYLLNIHNYNHWRLLRERCLPGNTVIWRNVLPSQNSLASICLIILANKTNIKPAILMSRIEIIGSMLISNKSMRMYSDNCRTISGTLHSFAKLFA